MAFCSQCGSELNPDSNTCPSCGAIIGAAPTISVSDLYDHTSEFDPKDVSDNKVYALCAYALSIVGIIIAALISKDSAYLKFHLREATKLVIVEFIVAFLTSLLCWTCIVPIAGIVFLIILFVVRVIVCIQVCMGQSKEPWLIRSLGFLH